MERGSESARGTGLETVNTTDERTGEKESPAAECNDYNQQRDDDGLSSGAADNGLNGGDDDLNNGDDDDIHGSDDDDRSSYDDYDDNEEEVDPGTPPCLRIHYDGDSYNIHIAYSFSRYLVEVLSVRPRFPFAGTFLAFNDCSNYYFCPQEGQLDRNVDSQGNLILRAQGGAIEDGFRVRIEIPHDNERTETGYFSFTVDEYACNNVITHSIPTKRLREVDLTFVALHCAIQANVNVYLDLTPDGGSSTGGTISVYGEISAHNQLYKDNSVMLFYCGEVDKSEVIDGKLPLLRPWAVVPVYLDPLLVIKLSLHVSTNPEHDRDGCTVSFQGDLTFDRDQYEKTICNADNHGEVKVRIWYQ